MSVSPLIPCLLLFAVGLGFAQNTQGSSLNELLANLPAVARANHLDLPMYGVQIDEAYKKDPSALEAAVPLLAKNLSNKEPWVQLETAVLIQGLAMESNDSKFVLRFSDQLAELIVSGNDEYTRGAAIGAVSILGQTMPDNVVKSLLAALNDKNSPQRVSSSAVGVILAARPNNAQVEDAFLSAVDDPDRSQQDRCQLLFNAGAAEGLLGQRIVDRIVKVINSSPPSECRDAAIGAADRVGLRALNPIVSRLRAVEGDPNESKESRQAAQRALDHQLHSVR